MSARGLFGTQDWIYVMCMFEILLFLADLDHVGLSIKSEKWCHLSLSFLITIENHNRVLFMVFILSLHFACTFYCKIFFSLQNLLFTTEIRYVLCSSCILIALFMTFVPAILL